MPRNRNGLKGDYALGFMFLFFKVRATYYEIYFKILFIYFFKMEEGDATSQERRVMAISGTLAQEPWI